LKLRQGCHQLVQNRKYFQDKRSRKSTNLQTDVMNKTAALAKRLSRYERSQLSPINMLMADYYWSISPYNFVAEYL